MDEMLFNTSIPARPPIFISREEELSQLVNTLLFKNDSIIITGYDAIGKSSLLQTFMDKTITNESNKVFTIWISMSQFYSSLREDFLAVITYQLCAEIWTSLFKYKYSELWEDTFINQKKNYDISTAEKSLKRIFKIVSNVQIARHERFDLPYEAIEETQDNDYLKLSSARGSLQAFEFWLLIDELMEIINTYGYNRILILCDELNHLPPRINYDLFSNYLNVFSSHKIQFAIVAINHLSDEMNQLIQSFSSRLELQKFNTVKEIEILVENSLSLQPDFHVHFHPDVYEQVFHITEGYPWWTVKLCNFLFYDSIFSKTKEVKNENLNKYIIPFVKGLSEYKETIKFGKSFSRGHVEEIILQQLKK